MSLQVARERQNTSSRDSVIGDKQVRNDSPPFFPSVSSIVASLSSRAKGRSEGARADNKELIADAIFDTSAESNSMGPTSEREGTKGGGEERGRDACAVESPGERSFSALSRTSI